ncbi:MAG: DMT family transporter [Cohaesibacter sp.]|jgi:drug/metabolite transporter (DMT)-like permease|nr:DMT family transporter [Cohaesibacter sp.]
MYAAEIAALSAAACWAVGSLLSANPVAKLGSIAFNRLRMGLVALMLLAYTTLIGTWSTIEPSYWSAIVWSAMIGIVLGDTALFITMRRLGPRRSGILFATNAPIATLLSWHIFDEHLSMPELTGTLLVIAGVMLAIMFGKRKDQLHKWENIQGILWIGIIWGLIAAAGQAVGSLIIKPVLLEGGDPIAVSAIRVSLSAISLILISLLPLKAVKPTGKLDIKSFWQIAGSGFIAMGVGMTLLLYAFTQGEIGIVASLSATTPVMMLPILWIKTKERPPLGAWIGAALVVGGSALIFTH